MDLQVGCCLQVLTQLTYFHKKLALIFIISSTQQYGVFNDLINVNS